MIDHGFLNVSEPLDEPTDNDLLRNDAWRGFFHDIDDQFVGIPTQAEAICAAPHSLLASALRYKQSQPTTVLVGQVKSATAACGAGQVVTGGGVYVSGPVSEAAVTGTAPADLRDLDAIPDDGWRGYGGQPERWHEDRHRIRHLQTDLASGARLGHPRAPRRSLNSQTT
jgi:hypothetical protein